MIIFYTSQPHYNDHCTPVFKRLCERYPETFLVTRDPRFSTHPNVRTVLPLKTAPKFFVVCSKVDAEHIAQYFPAVPRVWFEHGIGLSFTAPHVAYPGGHGVRSASALILSPNQWAFKRDAPNAQTVIVGTPKMDTVPFDVHRSFKVRRPFVVWQTHWNCLNFPETKSAFKEFAPFANELSRAFPGLSVHFHPRCSKYTRATILKTGLPVVNYKTAMRADMLIGDAGSMPYEFMAQNKPVLFLNSKAYRKSIDHGLRFWQDVPGLQCSQPRDLVLYAKQAWATAAGWQSERSRITEVVYPHRGTATLRAANEILNLLERLS